MKLVKFKDILEDKDDNKNYVSFTSHPEERDLVYNLILETPRLLNNTKKGYFFKVWNGQWYQDYKRSNLDESKVYFIEIE